MTTEKREKGKYRQIARFTYEVLKPIAVFGQRGGETKEINLISFNFAKPKYDIRCWKKDDFGEAKMLKGLALTRSEAIALRDALCSEFPIEKTKDSSFLPEK